MVPCGVAGFVVPPSDGDQPDSSAAPVVGRRGNVLAIAGKRSGEAGWRAGRVGVNPRNISEKIQIPSVKVAKFKAGKVLKETLKGNAPVEESSSAEPKEHEPVGNTSEEQPTEEPAHEEKITEESPTQDQSTNQRIEEETKQTE